MKFQTRLKEILAERELKQADLCRATGIPTSLMSNYVKGKASPTLDNAIKIAEKLNVTLDELVGRNVEFESPPKQTIDVMPEEAELVRMFQSLDKSGKRRVMRTVRGEYEDATANFGEESRNAI